MIHAAPSLEPIDEDVLAMIAVQRDRLRVHLMGDPRRWMGSIRRSTLARAIQGSNSIEGYHATVDQALAAVDNEPPPDGQTDVWMAIKGYRDALTYILQAARDPYFEFGKQFLKSLHFMMLGHEMAKHPGQWRPGGVFVVDAVSGDAVYEGPEAELVDGLVGELIEDLRSATPQPVLVKASMAHLNLAMIHPFKDGNGRMARALQTFVLAREGLQQPVFSSIEEWLGANTQDYYRVLGEVGRGRWNPGADALPWVRFCLKAHFQQAATLIRRNEEYGIVFATIEAAMAREKLPERMASPLFDVAIGSRLTNARYRSEAEVSEFVASRDLKRLCELGLLASEGENRGRSYGSGPQIQAIRESARIVRRPEDPYELAAGA